MDHYWTEVIDTSYNEVEYYERSMKFTIDARYGGIYMKPYIGHNTGYSMVIL